MWSDKETLNDCLGYASYVEVLSNICTKRELAPLTLGIFGAWGSGKTSLMSMLKYRLEQDTQASKTRTLWFNAWKYEGKEEAQSALIHAVLGKLTEGRTLADDAKEIVNRLLHGASVLKLAKFITSSTITLTPDLKGFLDCFRDQSRDVATTMEQFEKDFQELLSNLAIGHIVVFIDDLDRCPSTKVIETFETIKLFLNTPRCAFVIGGDRQRIEHAVAEVYSVPESRRTKDYIEKIIQLPFNIPMQTPQDVACYVGMLIVGRYLQSNDGWNAFIAERPKLYQAGRELCTVLLSWIDSNQAHLTASHEDIQEELTGILPYVGILGGGLRGNPRQIKRFLNILALRRQLAAANKLETDDALLVKMTVLEYVWDSFFTSLAETADPATGHSPLIDELMKDDHPADEDKSGLVSGFAGMTHLLAFLKNEPLVSADTDLRPYLFLAQTSINRGEQAALLPPDEKALSLARRIADADRIVSKAAALKVSAEEDDAVEPVIRHLLSFLTTSNDNRIRIHIVTGLDRICSKHPRFYPEMVKALERIDPSGNIALGVAGNTILANADATGVKVSPELKDRFTKAAGALEGLSGSRRTSKER